MFNDNQYSAPEDIFAPDNSESVVWGYPLELADFESFVDGHHPWRLAGETLPQYLARIGPMYLSSTAADITRWYGVAWVHPA